MRQPYDEEDDADDTPADDTDAPASEPENAPETPPDTGHSTPTPSGNPPPTPSAGGGSPPQSGKRPGTRPGTRTRPTGGISWRLWWTVNRANLVDLRGPERMKWVITGPAIASPRNALGSLAPEVRRALRDIAVRRTEAADLRATALRALARVGDASDVDVILTILRDSKEKEAVRESAALALALLPPLKAKETRERVRGELERCITGRHVPPRLRQLSMIAAGFRARDDEAGGLLLAARCKGRFRAWDEAAAMAMALGLAEDSLLLPELLQVATGGELGGAALPDVGRSHAVLALGRTGSPAALGALVQILKSRRVGAHSQRSAALALGWLLREGDLDTEAAQSASQELARVLDKGRDPLLRAYCAVALGAARPPQELHRLEKAVGRRGDLVVRPYAALGLGLAARELGAEKARPLRALLMNELKSTKDRDQSAALVLGLGLAGAREATPDLVARLGDRRSPATSRSAAAEALGLTGVASPEVIEALRLALQATDVHLASAAAESLGMLGDRASAVRVLGLLKSTDSAHLHSHLARVVGFSGYPAAAAPMLALLSDKRATTSARADAAMALGLLGGFRNRDALQRFGAWFNLEATTHVTRSLVTAGCGCRGEP